MKTSGFKAPCFKQKQNWTPCSIYSYHSYKHTCAQLYVDFPPTLWITHQLVGVALGGTATIECLTAAHPKSLNFWHDKFGQFISHK